MADLAQDLRYAVRTLGRNRGLSAVVIATLALGIGATTAIYSVVDGLLLRPLPFQDAERLVVATELAPEGRPPRPPRRPCRSGAGAALGVSAARPALPASILRLRGRAAVAMTLAVNSGRRYYAAR